MPRLNESQCAQIIALLEEGLSQVYVAMRMNVHQSSISRVWARYQQTGRFCRREGQGRRRITSAREDRFIVYEVVCNPTRNARQIANEVFPQRRISNSTIRRRLRERGFRSRARARVPMLSMAHRRARLQYARIHLNWTARQWNNVLFTDESRFCLFGSDARIRAWRRQRHRYERNYVEPVRAFGGGSIMIWGGISMHRRTDLVILPFPGVTAVRYIEEVLRPHVLPMRCQRGRNFLLMQDNARPHIARTVLNFFTENNIEVLPHPPNSPDLNPIEHVWDIMGRRLQNLERPPTNLQQLEIALQQIWHEIPQATIRACINMHDRLQEVIQRRGWNTHF